MNNEKSNEPKKKLSKEQIKTIVIAVLAIFVIVAVALFIRNKKDRRKL